jgi:hypothetical protein
MGTVGSSSDDDGGGGGSFSYEPHLNFRDVPANTKFSLLLVSSSALLVTCLS